MTTKTQQQLLNRWAQIKTEFIGVGSQTYKVRREDLLGPTGMQAGDELLDITQVAQRLGVPKSTVYELTRNRGRVRHDLRAAGEPTS